MNSNLKIALLKLSIYWLLQHSPTCTIPLCTRRMTTGQNDYNPSWITCSDSLVFGLKEDKKSLQLFLVSPLCADTTDWDTSTPSKSLYWVITNLSMVPHNINPTYGFFSVGSWMAEWAHEMRGSARWRDSCLFERWYQRGGGDFSPRRHCPDTLFASCHTAELESTQMVEGRCGTQRHFCMENKAWHTWAHTHWLGIIFMIDCSADYFHK